MLRTVMVAVYGACWSCTALSISHDKVIWSYISTVQVCFLVTTSPASCLSWSGGHLTTCASHLPLRAHALGRGNLRPLGRYIIIV